MQRLSNLRSPLAGILVLAGLGAGFFAPTAAAKDIPLTAIELYDGPSGAAYVQLSGVLINSKAEMKDCTPFQNGPVDKSTYGKMGRIVLAAGGMLERGSDGVLRYNSGSGQPDCVVPANARFDHGSVYSLSGLADQALLQGTPIIGGTQTPLTAPPIRKGVKLLFIPAPNLELAEYLRAQRAGDMDGWQAYLSRYPSIPLHSVEAKRSLAGLYASVGETSVQAYDKTVSDTQPLYSELKAAKAKAEKAHSLASDLPACVQLEKDVRDRLAAITEQGRGELDAYRAALASRTAGYTHLLNARKFSDTLAGIDSFYPQGQALTGDVLQETNTFESALGSADEAISVKQFDQAYSFVLPYRSFAEEDPRVAAIIDAAYGFHLDAGNKAEQSEDWNGAIKEFKQAASLKDTTEARESQQNAEKQLVISQDKAAAAKALAASRDFQAQHATVKAYEVLAALPATQKAIVADEMKMLEPSYVLAAAAEAKALHQAHSPIHGPADEVAIEKAYNLLANAYSLSDNESYEDKLDLDANELSAYLVDQAKHYLDKPGGSGTEIGWLYLQEARQYKASNLDAVRDAIVAAAPAHAMRSKLSIRVQFRDQTSSRDSQGVAGQLENAIITGLESSGVPVKVVRSTETVAVEPDFELAGDVLDHHLSVVPTIEPMESEYRFGEEQVPSDAWNKANRIYEKAVLDLQTAQTELQGATARGKKDEIKKQSDLVQAAGKVVEDAHDKLDSMPKTVTRDIIRPYTYNKKIINITGVIQLQFRIENSLTEQRTSLVPISREEHKKDVLLEDVKPDDTKGIKSTGTMTDTAEFMTALENSARDELITAVRKKVEALPETIYELALAREKEDDLDGAGEAYLRFLELSKDTNSPERIHARQFLLDSFNMKPITDSQQ